MKEQMKEYAERLEFETAQLLKEKIELIQNYQKRSTVVSPTIGNVDVFTVISDESFGYINFLRVNNGAIIQAHTSEIRKKLDETNEEILEKTIVEIFDRFGQHLKEILLKFVLSIKYV